MRYLSLSAVILISALSSSSSSPLCQCPEYPPCASGTDLDGILQERNIVKRDVDNDTDSEVGELIDERKCNNEELREIMLEKMTASVRDSKLAIMRAAEAKLGGHFNVICARGDFSYITTTRLYCLQSAGDINCYAFWADVAGAQRPAQIRHSQKDLAHDS